MPLTVQSPLDLLTSRIRERRAIIGVVGLGYVGISIAIAAAMADFPVLGFDVDPERVNGVNLGDPVISYFPADAVRQALDRGFAATMDMTRLGEPDVILICVPTPLTRQRTPDLSLVHSAAEAISKRLRRGQLIVLESTTWPGATEEFLKPLLELTGLRSGVDFCLAFSPEREDPGNAVHTLLNIPKVVSGDGEAARDVTQLLYQQIGLQTRTVSSTATAEAVKLTENIFRAVNIALVNELKVVYEAMGIDVWEVIDAAATKPFGFMAFQPGPGSGGHCIPIDPTYLTWRAREYDVRADLVELAGEINRQMPHYVVERLTLAVERTTGKGLAGSEILVIGVAYKRNVADLRESPALKLIGLLETGGAVVSYHDPLIDEISWTRDHPELWGRRSIALDSAVLKRFAAVLIVTDHDGVDYAQIVAQSALIIDTRNVCARCGLNSEKIVKS